MKHTSLYPRSSYDLRQTLQLLRTLSGLKKDMKRKLMEAAYLISQARHLDKAEQQFVEGQLIQRKRSGDLFVGGMSKETFRNYLDRMRKLGLQPLRIPDDRGVTHVSPEFDNFTLVDLVIEIHGINEWISENEDDFANYESTVADLKALYNRYRPR